MCTSRHRTFLTTFYICFCLSFPHHPVHFLTSCLPENRNSQSGIWEWHSHLAVINILLCPSCPLLIGNWTWRSTETQTLSSCPGEWCPPPTSTPAMMSTPKFSASVMSYLTCQERLCTFAPSQDFETEYRELLRQTQGNHKSAHKREAGRPSEKMCWWKRRSELGGHKPRYAGSLCKREKRNKQIFF